MAKINLDTHFNDPIKEWTARKHLLITRYVVPAAMMMKSIRGKREVALIDGFAGPNSYDGEVKGSTVIMVEAAKNVIEKGASATVYACEEDSDRYKVLTTVLADAIRDGILIAYNSKHHAKVEEIQKSIGSKPAIVFLDPQCPSELTLAGDLKPWTERKSTDILGVFMGGGACRACAQGVLNGQGKEKMEASLGENWRTATTLEAAYEVYESAIGPLKRHFGLYRLRKQEPKTDAYGIFGLSDSPNAMALLSDAVAKDWGVLMQIDASKTTPSLFDYLPEELGEQDSFTSLLELSRPILKTQRQIKGRELAHAIFAGENGKKAFGQYQWSDYTKAANHVRDEFEKKMAVSN